MKRLIVLLLTAVLLAGCAANPSDKTAETDFRAAGGETPLQDSAVSDELRTVALSASIAELWLEAGGTLAAATDDSFEERGLLSREECRSIGTIMHPNTELILSLDPDLVLLGADVAAHAELAGVLQEAGITCYFVDSSDFASYEADMRNLTELTGRADLYGKYVTEVKDQIAEMMDEASRQEPPTVLLLRAYSSGVKVKNTGTAAGVLDDLGALNIASDDASLLEELSLERIVEDDPDRIFITFMGDDEEAARAALETSLFSSPMWSALSAVRQGRVVYLPKELFHYKPNSRWVESYRYMYDELYS